MINHRCRVHPIYVWDYPHLGDLPGLLTPMVEKGGACLSQNNILNCLMVFGRHRLILLIVAQPLQCIRAQKAWKTQRTILPSGSFLGWVHPRHFKTKLYPVIYHTDQFGASGVQLITHITPILRFETV